MAKPNKTEEKKLEAVAAQVASRVRVQLLRDASYRGANYSIGRVIRVAAETAQAWIAGGTAVAVDGAPPKAGGDPDAEKRKE